MTCGEMREWSGLDLKVVGTTGGGPPMRASGIVGFVMVLVTGTAVAVGQEGYTL